MVDRSHCKVDFPNETPRAIGCWEPGYITKGVFESLFMINCVPDDHIENRLEGDIVE